MILVDTSIWVNHLNQGDADLGRLLDAGRVVCHPFVIGEVALGYLHRRIAILDDLQLLPQATVAREDEVLRLIFVHELCGAGIGFVDVHLLAAAKLTPGVSLWTRDKRLFVAAKKLGLAFEVAP